VKRGGGIVSLAPVVAGLDRIQRGTDATALELRIRRLRDEIRDAEAEFRDTLEELICDDFVGVRSALRDIRILSFFESRGVEPEELQRIVKRLGSADLREFGDRYARGFFGPDARKLEVVDTLSELRAGIEERSYEIELLRDQVSGT
jgi:hypothetical protein